MTIENEWHGMLPESWERCQIRRRFHIVNGSTPKSDVNGYWNGDIPWATPDDLGALQFDTLYEPSRYISREGYESCGTTLVPQGSLVLSTRAPIGHVAITGVPMCTNQGCRALVPIHPDDETRYYYYQCVAARQHFDARGMGSTFAELGRDRLAEFVLAVPPYEDQRAIAAFLDRKTAQVDALIAAYERLLTLLEEKRQAVITQAVTQGLDPTVTMKDSGVAWLGQVPAHWRVMRNKVLFEEFDHRNENEAVELLSVSHITGVTKRSEKNVNMFLAESLIGYKICLPGDLVINTMWAWMGALGISPHEGVVSPSYNVYRIRQGTALDPGYYDYLCRTPRHVTTVKAHSTGVWESRLRLYPNVFLDLRTCVPPLEEQRAIVQHIQQQLHSMDGLAEKCNEGMVLLTEYRAALVTAAVTGQIEVREEVAQDA